MGLSVLLLVGGIVGGAVAGGFATWFMLRRVYERVAYFERKVQRQEQDILMLNRYLLTSKTVKSQREEE